MKQEYKEDDQRIEIETEHFLNVSSKEQQNIMLTKVKLNNINSWLILKRNVSIVSGANVQESVRKFEEIPGTKGILGIGNFYNYFKNFGNFSVVDL